MERKYLFGIQDNGKTAGMISYFFVIGWSIGYFGFHKNNKESLSAFHLRQTLFLYLSYLVIRFGMALFLGPVWPYTGLFSFYNLMMLVNVVFIVLWVIGLVGATNAEKKPIPFFGKLAQKLFAAI